MMEATTLIPRYSRQMIVPSVGGLEGQRQLSSTSVLVVGAGGIGSSVLLYLAGAGIGHIEVLDFDVVEISNLHRQVLHDTKSQGQLKCDSAIQRMKALNPTIQCTSSSVKLTVENAIGCFKDFDIVVDATDNFEARYIINDACVLLGKPLVSGSAVGLEGQITVFAPRIGPCYRCVYPIISPLESCRSCANAGVLGPVPGLIGCMQAMETIKVILSKEDIIAKVKQAREIHHKQNEMKSSLQINNNETQLSTEPSTSSSSSTIGKSLVGKDLQTLIGRQVFYDATVGEFHNFVLPPRNLHCAVCGDQPTIHSMEQCGEFLKKGAGSNHTGSSSSSGNKGVHDEIQQCSMDCTIPINPTTSATAITHITPLSYYQDICMSRSRHIVLDVRSDVQFAMVSFEWYQQPEAQQPEAQFVGQTPMVPSHVIITSRKEFIESMVQSALIVHISLDQLKQMTRTVTINPIDTDNSNNVLATSLHNVITSLFTKEIKQTDSNGIQKQYHHGDSETSMDQPLPPIYVLCRRGIDSIAATTLLMNEYGLSNVFNIDGGLTAWQSDVDHAFPIY